jgi:tetratricopeptide (TPR) repeat protein
MAPLLQTCDLDLWDDRRIGAGEDWFAKIQEALNAASLAILLVSPYFLASKFITEVEVPRLLERRFEEGLRFFPILVRNCNFELYAWLSRMQLRPQKLQALALKSDPEIDEALTEIVKEMHGIFGSVPSPPATPGFVPVSPEIYTAKLPMSDPVLFGREDELRLLDAAWATRTTNIVCLVAQGGVGKTALVNRWLRQIGDDNYRGAARVFGWSFYSQGTREDQEAEADTCISKALEWFKDPDPVPTNPWDRGVRLAQLARRERCLLILDGLEPLQYPPGDMGGRLKDQGLQGLLRELARYNPGLCIITSRLPVADLREFTHDPANPDAPLPTVVMKDLDTLSLAAGRQLLEYLGLKGESGELERAAGEFRGHAFALILLGTYLKKIYRGDVLQRDKIKVLTREPERGPHAWRMLAAYERWFRGQREGEILALLGLFDRPAPVSALTAITAPPAIPGLTKRLQRLSREDWRFAEHKLRDARLLEPEAPHNPNILDCHPLVREYFGERLQQQYPESWQAGHSRLYEYYKNLAPDLPETLEAMAPLYAAVTHGCRAGRHMEALGEVFWQRIYRRDKHFSRITLGALAADLAALSAFFELPWETPEASLDAKVQAFLFNEVGLRLWGLGRVKKAQESFQAGLERRIAQEDWNEAAKVAQNFANLTGVQGDLFQAEAIAHQGLSLAKRSGEKVEIMDSQCALAFVRHQRGAEQEAGALFRQAEAMQKELQPQNPYLYSFRGYQFCDLLLDQGEYQVVLTRTGITLAIAEKNKWLRTIGLDHLSLGRACLAQWLKEGEGDLAQAAEHFNKAVDFLRRGGMQHHLVQGLLGRAAFFRASRDWPAAHRDLEEALEMCQRSGMRLYEADCHLEYARLHLAQGEKEEARQSLAIAKEMIQQMGYHRRDREVKELEEQL